jgi:hypothetical protein
VLDVFSDLGGIFEIFKNIGFLLIIPFNKKASRVHIINKMMSETALEISPKFKQKRSRVVALPADDSIQQLNDDQENSSEEKEEGIRKSVNKYNYWDITWMSIP